MIKSIKDSPEFNIINNSLCFYKRKCKFIEGLRNLPELDKEIRENIYPYETKYLKSIDASRHILSD